MRRLRELMILLTGLLLVSVLAACIKLETGPRQETRFYTLAPLTEAEAGTSSWTLPAGVTMGIGPIKLAKYLDRPQIVTSVSPTEFHFAEFDYWSEPLSDDIGMVVRENLTRLLHSERLLPFPWRLSRPVDVNLQLIVEVIAMDGRLDQTAHLNLRWVLTKTDSPQPLALEKFEINEPVSEPGYEGLVAAWSRGFGAFSRRVAQVLEQSGNLP